VEKILRDLGLSDKPIITVINKIDMVVGNLEEAKGVALSTKSPPESTIVISAFKKWNLDKLLEKIGFYL
jgi:GTP-binding protein HflX